VEANGRGPSRLVRFRVAGLQGFSQKDLVARTDFSKGEVSDWVNGKERWNRDVLFAFAHAIGVEAAALLQPPPTPTDDEFSRFVVSLDQKAKERALRLLRAAGLGDGADTERAA
jgi:transcriptional regulator with XRE-family HTH domain